MVNCHTCGGEGHVARDCTHEADVGARPAWCGECDRQTRLVDHGDYITRCRQCWAWPAKGTRFHQLLPQHKRCGGCSEVIYAFDGQPCGEHRPLGIDSHGHRPEPSPPPGAAAIAAQARHAITREAP